MWGLGQRPNRSAGDQYAKRAQQRCRQRSVPASNFALPQERPQAAHSTTHILSRQMGATDQYGKRFVFPMLVFSVSRGFRACGRESGALRSPPTPLRTALPCFLIFLVAGGIAPAGATRGLSDRPLDSFGSHYRSWFLSLQGELHILNIAAKTIIEIARGFSPPHFSISITLRLNTARPWFFLSVRKRLSVFSSTAMSIGLERCMSMPASKLC